MAEIAHAIYHLIAGVTKCSKIKTALDNGMPAELDGTQSCPLRST